MCTQVSITKATTNDYIRPIQSANTLFHFVNKINYLTDIIERDAIVPRYCVENVIYLKIPYNEIAYPMLCFCDINLHKINEHIHFYGGYGIAFSKQWGIEKGIQPIQYINVDSDLRKAFSKAFNMALDSIDNDLTHDYLLAQMYFFKPIEGDMPREKTTEHKNFTDECEWRYIPNVTNENMPGILTGNELFQRDTLNRALMYAIDTWLKFSVNNVKYLIIQNSEDFDVLIDAIMKKSNLTEREKNILISKIILWSESEGDF